MISQSGHSALTFFPNSGRSWAPYRAVFVSGRSRAILPPLPLPPPPPPLSSLPHAAIPPASASAATADRTALNPFRLNVPSFGFVRLLFTPAPLLLQQRCLPVRAA